MAKASVRTERERRVKARGSVRRSARPTIAESAARLLTPLVDDAERSLAKVSDGRGGAGRVHKLRATLRRVEALTAALGCGFDARPAGKLGKAARRARRVAGDVRDMDVAIALVGKVCTAGGAAAEQAGGVIVEVLGARREKALKKLASMSREETGVLQEKLTAMLDAPAGRRARLPSRCAAVVGLARGAAAMNDAVRAGLRTPELLHELRLNLKEARTILETLGGTVGQGAKVLAKRAKAISDVLGEVNDLVTLGELMSALEDKGEKKERASARLVGGLVRRSHRRAHVAGVRLARREVPRLVRGIRGLIFGEK